MTATIRWPCVVDGCDREADRWWKAVRVGEPPRIRRQRPGDGEATLVWALRICEYHDGLIDICVARGALSVRQTTQSGITESRVTLVLPKVGPRQWRRARGDALNLLRRLTH